MPLSLFYYHCCNCLCHRRSFNPSSCDSFVTISSVKCCCLKAMSMSLVKIKPNRDSKIAHEQLSPQLTLLWTLKAVKGLPWKGGGTCLQLLAHGTAHLDKN